MGSGIKGDALANAGRGIQQQTSARNQMLGFAGRGDKLYNTMFPTLRNELINPQGFGSDMNAINTANQQSIGGSVAGAVGQGNLMAARTGNAGGFAPALDEAARSGARQLSQNAVGTQEANAYLKQQQREQATQALGNIYGENTNATLRALGLGNDALQTSNQALGIAGNQKSFGSILGDSLANALGNSLGNVSASVGGFSMGA